VKLLLDENLSPRLIRLIAKEFPEAAHVRDHGLRGAADSAVWTYCAWGRVHRRV
jgi:predicted nuclease of predicted toxin-antitoxin system